MVLISSFYYLAFNKPYGVLSQFSDLENRETLKNYINLASVYPAGRLDRQSEGLLILSNDGSFIQKLTEPQFEHPKTYIVQVEGSIKQEDMMPLQSKILLPGFQTRLADVQIITNPALPPPPCPCSLLPCYELVEINPQRGQETSCAQINRCNWVSNFTIIPYRHWKCDPWRAQSRPVANVIPF